MAAGGYKCEFKDRVFEGFYCKKCTLVARGFTMATCCGGSFCQDCIADSADQCPACGQKGYSTFPHSDFQKMINSLTAFCTMKERGCGWSGTLDQLDSHLDPEQDNCQYVDIKCPLNCQQDIPRNKMEQHIHEECAKRDYSCKHCNYKASYEEVVDIHLTECKYVPLDCPNRCGVTLEREFLEGHMKVCRSQVVGCDFRDVGCEEQFKREDQDGHNLESVHHHLTLTALHCVKTKEQLQHMAEQEKCYKESERKLHEIIEMLRKDTETKLQRQHQEHKEEEQKLMKELKEQYKQLQQYRNKLQEQEKKINNFLNIFPDREFELNNFSQVKKENGLWKSPAMYTHMCGYKFRIGVNANGYGFQHGKAVYVRIFVMPGEYDTILNWPAKVKFTLDLIHPNGENYSGSSGEIMWDHYITKFYKTTLWLCGIHGDQCDTTDFIEHCKLKDFLVNDTLRFCVSIKLL